MGAREPCFEAYRPALGAVTTMASVIGRNRTPASNAEYPWISCMYNERKKNEANIPSETENATRFPAEKAGMRKNRRGIMGCGERSSHHRNETRRTPAPTSEPMISGSLQPRWLASMRPYVAK